MKKIASLVLIFSFLFPASLFCTSWSSVTDISSNLDGIDSFSVSINDSQNALGVWVSSDASGNNTILGALFTSGFWGTATTLSNGTNSGLPDVSFNNNGIGFAIWIEQSGANYLVKTSLYNGGWQTGLALTSSGFALDPIIRINNNGNAVAMWTFFDGTNEYVQAAVYSSGSWGTVSTLNSGLYDTGDVRVAFNDSNIAIAVWTENDGTSQVINSSTYSSSWSAATTISTNGIYSSHPQIAINNNGDGMAIWDASPSSTQTTIQALGYSSSSGWSATPTNLTDGTISSYFPRIGFNILGNAAAAWIQDNGTRNVYASIFFSNTWASPINISQSAAVDPSVQVVLNDNNQAIAVWAGDLSGNVIQAITFQSGAWDTTPTTLTNSSGVAMNPTISINNTGNAYAGWTNYISPNYMIQGTLGTL